MFEIGQRKQPTYAARPNSWEDGSVDQQTLAAYDRSPETYAAEWHDQPEPSDLYALLRHFFIPGFTADIGCGAGRDTAWLNANGYPAIGYDASPGLLAEARRRHPEVRFEQASLPELAAISEGPFTNVLCETVIMHLDEALIGPSVTRLLALVEASGVLYLSWRVTAGDSRRDDNGRLYSTFDATTVRDALSGTEVLHDSEVESLSSSRIVHRTVVRASPG
jgi:SAM-dependent methyltransferase